MTLQATWFLIIRLFQNLGLLMPGKITRWWHAAIFYSYLGFHGWQEILLNDAPLFLSSGSHLPKG